MRRVLARFGGARFGASALILSASLTAFLLAVRVYLSEAIGRELCAPTSLG